MRGDVVHFLSTGRWHPDQVLLVAAVWCKTLGNARCWGTEPVVHGTFAPDRAWERAEVKAYKPVYEGTALECEL